MNKKRRVPLLSRRTAGVLLHITSLPGRHGIGDLGQEAFAFADWAAAAGFSLWQVLPLVPAGKGNSPYCSWTAFGGNPLLISLDWLCRQNLLKQDSLKNAPLFDEDRVDFDAVAAFKIPLLRKAANEFISQKTHPLKKNFAAFCRDNVHWLDDAVLFSLLHEKFRGKDWQHWPEPIRQRDSKAIAAEQKLLAHELLREKAIQFFFEIQWQQLRTHCQRLGLALVGDVPIYVGLNSADVWTHRDLFKLTAAGHPVAVAGVPPDAFSQTGQLWGNPVYDWAKHRSTKFRWWIARMNRALALTDLVRIDHFRGLASYWEVPAKDKDARGGTWVPGPGHDFFNALEITIGALPIIAEDLGYITQEVHELRDKHGMPGMAILQFAFGSTKQSEHLPHTYPRNRVVYPGTHDNETLVGWWRNLSENTRIHTRKYLGLPSADERAIAEAMQRECLASHANHCVVPMQDLLGLGNEARMNTPGSEGPHNWSWRMSKHATGPFLAASIHETITIFGRLPE